MPTMGRGTIHEDAEMIEMAENGPQSLPLRLTFVMSAYNTAQRMIRFSDEKASFVFLFFGIILSIFGVRGDRILLILGGQARPGSFRALFIALFLLFLGTMVVSLLYGLRTIIPHLRAPAASPDHLRLYWFQDVLRLPPSEYLARLQGLSDEGVVREMVQELYVVTAIERAKFDRINHCLRWAVASFILWVIVILMTLGS